MTKRVESCADMHRNHIQHLLYSNMKITHIQEGTGSGTYVDQTFLFISVINGKL